jgi:hypothetical protein
MYPVAYHEMMHTTIWEWIRGRCEDREQTHPMNLPHCPLSILQTLIDTIEQYPIHPSRTSLSFRFVTNEEEEDNIFQGTWMNGFGETVCSKGQRLYDAELQRKISWTNMKDILEFYLNDSTNYIVTINALNMNANALNEYFELGIDFDTETMNDDLLRDRIVWSRYLTGTRIWFPDMQNGGFLIAEGLARGEEYWSGKVYNAVFNYPVENPSDEENELGEIVRTANRTFLEQTTQLNETEKKKNDALRRIQEFLDEIKEDIGDGVYLDIMNILGDNFVRRR